MNPATEATHRPLAWPAEEHVRGEYIVSTDPLRLDRDLIHRFLSLESYWARGVSRELVDRSIENSLCFGLYHEGQQIGFARVVTDHAVFGYLADVFVLEPYRGQRLATWLLECILSHQSLQGLRRMNLVTRDAHSLYRPFGFGSLATPGMHMERVRPLNA